MQKKYRMIKKLSILNFKSIKKLQINCKRINVFIGEPNTGKSNILEALAFFSQGVMSDIVLKEIFRFNTISNLFYDENINEAIEITIDDFNAKMQYAYNDSGAVLNQFHLDFKKDGESNYTQRQAISHEGNLFSMEGKNFSTPVRYYRFKSLVQFQPHFLPHLSSPYGDNIPGVILSNPALKKWVSELFRSLGYKLMITPAENKISMSKEVNEELFSYPYQTISETLQRLIFYSLAIKSNKNAVLLFDEPESNMFPFYIKDIAERITEEQSNQFFITTHNPYLLGSLLEKADKSEINVFITRMKDYQTTATLCSDKQMQELISLGSGSFFNLENLINS